MSWSTTSMHDVVYHDMYVYYCRTYEKAVSGGGDSEREKGGHVLRQGKSEVLPCFINTDAGGI